MPARKRKRLAVLFDADNVPSTVASLVLTEVAGYGNAIVRRVHGDWTTPHLQGWKEVLPELAIHPMQQFRYSSASPGMYNEINTILTTSHRPIHRGSR